MANLKEGTDPWCGGKDSVTMTKRPTPKDDPGDRRGAAPGDRDDPPIRLAHVLFVLWVSGSVAWAFFAAKLAHDQDWWVQRPDLGAILVLVPPILAHVLANYLIRLTGNPMFRSGGVRRPR